MNNQITAIPELPIFNFVDAHAGSGKTYIAHQHIKSVGGFFTIATQTNELSEQQHRDLLEIGVQSTVIRLKKASDNCTKKYARHCKDRRESVALINQKVALQCLEDARIQHLLCDEFFSPVEKYVLIEDISATRAFISNLIKAVPCEFEGVLEVLDTDDTAEIAEFGKTRKSSIAPHVIEFCKRAHSPHYRIFVAATNCEN